jgi:Protein of unknown function (DUF3105)
VSSRQEEKERRRKEREAAEQAAQSSAARRKRMGLVGGGVLLAAILVIVALAAFSGGGDDGETTAGDSDGPLVEAVAAPTQNVTNLQDAARAAKCKLESPREEGSDHVTETVQYRSNPPTSGNHDPVPAEDGEYSADSPPDPEQSVHALEHGRILFQYKEGSPAQRAGQLKSVFEEEFKGTPAYHALFFQNQTNMEAAVAATAWTQSLTCPQWNDQVFDALRAFRRQYTDRGPEFVP